MSDGDQFLTHRLRAHVKSLAEEIGERNVFNSEALRRAAAYIEAEWSALGYGVERLEYDVSGIRCANLIAIREGSTRRKEILLLGAHYDSVVGSPGANDNASGVAALPEISRMFQTFEPELTVHFVAFVNEEPPFFWTGQQGSMVYAQAARRRGDDIRLMASLETIGCYSSEPGSQRYPPLFRFFYPDCGNFIGIVSLWVKSRHRSTTGSCPLYLRKRTSQREHRCPLFPRKRGRSNVASTKPRHRAASSLSNSNGGSYGYAICGRAGFQRLPS